MLYRLHLTGNPAESAWRKREDAARLAAERMAYDALEGNGLLDSAQAHKVMARIAALDFKKGGEVVVIPYDHAPRVLFVTPSLT